MQTINAKTRMAAVVANPIRHSLSPFIHNLAFEWTQENGVYLAFESTEKELKKMIENISLLDMYGLNISMPYKRKVLEYVDDKSAEVELIGAANTLVQKRGRIIAHNTDGLGFFEALKEKGYQVFGQEILIFGGGGAAKAVIGAAITQGVDRVHVIQRLSNRFSELKDWIFKLSNLTGVAITLTETTNQKQVVELLATSSLIVNATPQGMGEQEDANPIPDAAILDTHSFFAEMVYQNLETPFSKSFEGKGLSGIKGLDMLLHQAKGSFELFCEKSFPLEKIKERLFDEAYRR